LTGVSTAWHLSRRFPDRRIVLLEAAMLGNGATGRSGGQLLTGANLPSATDPQVIRRCYDVTCRAIDRLGEWAEEYGIRCGFSRRGCQQIFTSSKSADAAQALVERWRNSGVPVEWQANPSPALEGARGAIVDPAAGRVNPVALLRGMRPVLLLHGVTVWEYTPVLKIEEGAPVRLVTPFGEVRADAIVLASNAYTPRLGYFRESILPLHSHVVATVPLNDGQLGSVGWRETDGFSDDRSRITFGTRTDEGRVLFGGGSNAAYAYRFGGNPVFEASERKRARTFGAVEDRLGRYAPALGSVPIEHRWTGTLGLTFDRICTMGVRGERRNVFYALGYSGHGLALATLAGEVLCDLYGGEHESWQDLPFYQRALPRIPPEPLRWLGYQLYTRATGRSPRR
jgi:glycine/D-amino acid oxidase-like deaminating enzyme